MCWPGLRWPPLWPAWDLAGRLLLLPPAGQPPAWDKTTTSAAKRSQNVDRISRGYNSQPRRAPAGRKRAFNACSYHLICNLNAAGTSGLLSERHRRASIGLLTFPNCGAPLLLWIAVVILAVFWLVAIWLHLTGGLVTFGLGVCLLITIALRLWLPRRRRQADRRPS